mgnify:CR=1 FL=1
MMTLFTIPREHKDMIQTYLLTIIVLFLVFHTQTLYVEPEALIQMRVWHVGSIIVCASMYQFMWNTRCLTSLKQSIWIQQHGL